MTTRTDSTDFLPEGEVINLMKLIFYSSTGNLMRGECNPLFFFFFFFFSFFFFFFPSCFNFSFIVKELVEDQHVDVNGYDYDRRTPLHLASASGRTEVVQYLLDQGAEVNSEDR